MYKMISSNQVSIYTSIYNLLMSQKKRFSQKETNEKSDTKNKCMWSIGNEIHGKNKNKHQLLSKDLDKFVNNYNTQ